MPFKPMVGDPVMWYFGGDRAKPGFPGIVTRVDMGTQVLIHCASPDSQKFIIRDGSKHCDDPTANDQQRLDNGGWDYTDRVKMLMRLVNDLLPKAEPAKPPEAPKK